MYDYYPGLLVVLSIRHCVNTTEQRLFLELIVSKYVAESMTMIAGRFGHEGLCQLHTKIVFYLQ